MFYIAPCLLDMPRNLNLSTFLRLTLLSMLPLTFHWHFRNPVLKGNFYNKVSIMFSTIKKNFRFLKNYYINKIFDLKYRKQVDVIQPLVRIFRGLTGKIGSFYLKS